MKRPWIITPKGQRTTMHIANVGALLLFVAFVFQYQFVEQPRSEVPQLDTSNVTYCELTECGEMFGIELENGAVAAADSIQTPIGVELSLKFVNQARLDGRRELWLRMDTRDGEFVEAASTWIDLGLKTHTVAKFMITGLKAEIENSKIYIGY